LSSNHGLRLPDGGVPDAYFVDLDGTLISRSSEKFFVGSLMRNRVLKASGMMRFALGYLFHPVTTLREGKGWNRRYLIGLEPRQAMEIAGRCAETLISEFARKWTLRSIRELEESGGRVFLLSATLEPIAGRFSEALGLDGYRASVPALSDGGFTGGLDGPRPWGKTKMEIAGKICSEEGTSLEKCAAAGDSWSDRHLLESCGCPVAVCPDRKLRKLASGRGWRIVEGRHTRWA